MAGAKSVHGLEFNSEQFVLPWDQQRCGVGLIRRDRLERATRRDKGRLQIDFSCRAVASLSELFGPAYRLGAWSRPKAAVRDGPFRFRQL